MNRTTDMTELTPILAGSKLFSGLDLEELGHIGERFGVVRFPEGEVVFREGDKSDYLYVIGSGSVGLYKRMGQSDHELIHLGEGEHFGEMAMISSARRTATVKAATDLCCARMDEAGFNALLEDDERFAQRMLSALTERLRHTDETATRDMVLAHQALSFSLAKLADSRDPETGAHLYRVREYCVLLSELLRDHPQYGAHIDDTFIENIYHVAPLHDIGKVAIPDGVLMKQGKLTDAEFEIMATHTTLGAEALDAVIELCDVEMFQMARRVILNHHERYDGKGYPRGVKGEDIPVEARIMTMADIYDALLSERVYKRAFEYHEARDEMASYAGNRFEPEMTRVMIDNIGQFEAVHRQFKEDAEDDAGPL